MDSYLERLRQELEDATGDASASGLTHAPAGKWNAAQILEHLPHLQEHQPWIGKVPGRECSVGYTR
jgi:hypothetical protein